MYKRGQVTIFIIVGLLVFLTVLGLVFLKSSTITETITTNDNLPLPLQPLLNYVDDCLEKSTIQGMKIVFEQGGYDVFPDKLHTDSFLYEGSNVTVPVYFDVIKSNIPDISIIQQNVARVAEKQFVSCIGNFSLFTKQGYTITYNQPQISISFEKKMITTNADYPLIVTIGSQKKDFQTFSRSIPFDFISFYNTILEYGLRQEKEKDYFLMGDLSSLLSDLNMTLSFKQEGESGEKVFVHTVFPSKLNEVGLSYNFGLQFKWNNENNISVPVESSEPSLALYVMDPWLINQEGVFNYSVKAKGENVSFKIEPEGLKIDEKKGVITLNTTNFFNNEYEYYVIITDDQDRTTAGPLYLFVNIDRGGYPKIKPVPRQYAKVGEKYNYQVQVLNRNKDIYNGINPQNNISDINHNSNNSSLHFFTDSSLFLINESTGVISFVPKKDDIGYYSVRVDVANDKGSMWQRWEMIIS